jgi:hypothetical protein
VADQLYLSYWLRAFDDRKVLRHFEKLLPAPASHYHSERGRSPGLNAMPKLAPWVTLRRIDSPIV